MTLQVVISVPNSQGFGAKVEVVDSISTGEVIASTQELQPGECYQTYLTSTRSFKVTEIPFKLKE